MTCSPARLLANQANARRSTGPRTAEGRRRASMNSLKHGLTGAGLVLRPDDAAQIERSAAALQAELAPADELGRLLVRQVALASARLDRAAEHELAAVARRVRHAPADHDEARAAGVSALLDGLAADPAASVRRLLRTPEGVDALVESWLDLRADLARPGRPRWTAAHAGRARHLTGRRPDAVTSCRVDDLSRAIGGDFAGLDDHEGQGLDASGRRLWAAGELVGFIDEEVAALGRCREGLDLEDFEADRAEAGDRALFDPSAEATLARRYQAAAERLLFRALKELREAESRAAERPEPAVPPGPASRALGSFFPVAEEVAAEAEEAAAEADPEPESVSGGRREGRPRPNSAEVADLGPMPAEAEGVEPGAGRPSGFPLRR